MLLYDTFINSIKNLKKMPLPSALLECISQENLMAIVDDLISNENRQRLYQNLKPKQSIRISKADSKLARTFCVLRDHDGTYQCILETKSKNALNLKKPNNESAQGSRKFGKPAWRLDCKKGPKPHFSLRMILSTDTKKSASSEEVVSTLKNIQEEIDFAWEFPKDSGLQRNTLGPVHVNKKGLVVSVYSKKGTPLHTAIENEFGLTEQEKDDISSSLLQTVDLLHSKGIVYQDIKPDNIIVYRRPNKKIKAKLIDPGSIYKPDMDPKTACLATYGYESPEVALAHSKQTIYSNYYRQEYKKSGLTLGKVEANKILNIIKKKGPKKVDQELQSVLKPHPANDMWALGATLHFLYRKKLPNPDHVPTNAFFARFFAPRHQRFTAKEAIEKMQSMLKIKII